MNNNPYYKILTACIFVCGLILGSCREGKPLTSSPVPSLSQPPSQTKVSIPSATAISTVAPTLNENYIVTPDDLFTMSGLELLNTPSAINFCENIPSPQVVEGSDEFSLLRGRFVLCVSISWPLEKTAIDIDASTLVSMDDKSGDLAMDYTHPDLDGVTSYAVYGLNNAHTDETETDLLNYRYCENMLTALGKNDPGVFIVNEGATACVTTTEDQIVLIRVEHIFPLDTQGVEFSFAILKKSNFLETLIVIPIM